MWGSPKLRKGPQSHKLLGIIENEGKVGRGGRAGVVRRVSSSLKESVRQLVVGRRKQGREKEKMTSSVDSGLGLDSSSSSILDVDDPRTWSSAASSPSLESSSSSLPPLAPILRSPGCDRARATVGRKISFSVTQQKLPRASSYTVVGPRASTYNEGEPRASNYTAGGPRARVYNVGGPRARVYNMGGPRATRYTVVGPRATSMPQSVRVTKVLDLHAHSYYQKSSVAPQLENIYMVVFRQVQCSLPEASPTTLAILFCPGPSLPSLVSSLTGHLIGQVLADMRTLLFPVWPSLDLSPLRQGVLLHLLHCSLAPLLAGSLQAPSLASLTKISRTNNYTDVPSCLDCTRQLFLSFWCGLIRAF